MNYLKNKIWKIGNLLKLQKFYDNGKKKKKQTILKQTHSMLSSNVEIKYFTMQIILTVSGHLKKSNLFTHYTF